MDYNGSFFKKKLSLDSYWIGHAHQAVFPDICLTIISSGELTHLQVSPLQQHILAQALVFYSV
jgi:hypothetical protein